uniref:Reverse transcriptase domain-containing protein n=1 Tax=Tanacetum cinerariifolium TaxID=118510 RepID=A0A699GNL8_TANCI|nr:reverse transcriptase domain-containing protein [Tanacetum cinerariifolium]
MYQTVWATASIKKVKDVVKFQALIDKKKVVVTKDIIRKDLQLDDADGVDCLLTKETFVKLTRMGYEKPPPKLTFYKAFFFAQWKFLIHTLVQCMSAKRTTWNEFSCSMTSAVIYLATVDDLSSHSTKYTSPALTQKAAAEEEDEEDEVPAAPTPPSPTHEPTPPSHEPITSPPQAQSTCTTLSYKVVALEQDKVDQALEILKLKRRVKKLEKQRRSKHFGLKRLRKVGADEDITLVDIETEVDLGAELQGRLEEKDETLIKMKAEKARILDEQMAKRPHDEEVKQAAAKEKQEQDYFKRAQVLQQKYDQKQENIDWNVVANSSQEKTIVYLKNMAGYKMEHFKGMTYDQVRPIFEREYNKVQTFFKSDRDEEPTKKRVAKETLLQESFKKLRAEVEVLGSHSTQDTPTIDPKEMSEEDVQNMLQIILVAEFRVEDLQVKYPIIGWEIHSEGSRSYWKIVRVGDVNPIRTLRDYSKPSHEGYRNTIELPEGNNMDPSPHGRILLLVSLLNSFQREGLQNYSMISLCSNNIKENLSQKHGLVSRTYFKKSLIIASTFGSKSKSFMTMPLPPQDKPLTNLLVNDPRDFAKPVKAISLPQDVLSTSDRRLIDLEHQVQHLIEAHIALMQPTQVKKITSLCEICSGPHDTQYCMENPEQAFVEYASSRIDEAGGDSNFGYQDDDNIRMQKIRQEANAQKRRRLEGRFGQGEGTKAQLKILLKKNMDIFAWEPADKMRVLSLDRSLAVIKEVEEWLKAGIDRPVKYLTWISDPVLVNKVDRSWRMCIDFNNINSACPKDYYPLRDINQNIESLMGYRYKCFLDAYKGYHQVHMAKDDEEKTAFYNDQALNWFLARSAKRSLPFFDTMKNITKENKDEYRWIEEEKMTFLEMKNHNGPSLTDYPIKEEALYVYLTATLEALSAVLLTERKGKQFPVHYVSRTLNEA